MGTLADAKVPTQCICFGFDVIQRHPLSEVRNTREWPYVPERSLSIYTMHKAHFQQRFHDEVAPKVMEQFGLSNRHQLPKLSKIVLNCGVGRFLENQKLKPEVRDTVISTLSTITGQKPVMVAARKAVSNFKVREGAPSAFMVTIRRDRMWHFLDRLINLAVPRIKDCPRAPSTAAGPTRWA